MSGLTKRALRSRLLRGAKQRAVAKGIPFAITANSFVVPHFCPILGVPLKHERGPMADASPTLDRIRPGRGYIEGNVIVVCARANRLKSDATVDELGRLASFYQQLTR